MRFPCKGAELWSRVRGGKGWARFPGPTKLTTGGGAIRNFSRKHLQGQTFPIRGGKVTLFPPLIVKFTYLYYGLSLFRGGGKLPT